MYLVRGTPDKVFELIFIQLLSRYGAVNAWGLLSRFLAWYDGRLAAVFQLLYGGWKKGAIN